MNSVDYGAILTGAWSLTWRSRSLWFIALLTGSGGGGVSFNPQVSAPGDELFSEFAPFTSSDQLTALFNDGTLLILSAILGLLLIVAFTVVSLIAQGGMARASIDQVDGEQVGFGTTWRTGLALLPRTLGVWLLPAGFTLLISLLSVGMVIGAWVASEENADVTTLLVLGLIALITVVLPVFALLSVLVPFAMRAIAEGGVSPLAAYRYALGLMRRTPVACLILWLLSLVLSVGIIVLVFGLFFLVTTVLMFGVLLVAFSGVLAPLVAIVLGVTVCFTVLLSLLVAGITNTFFWHYWSLAYRQLQQASRPAS